MAESWICVRKVLKVSSRQVFYIQTILIKIFCIQLAGRMTSEIERNSTCWATRRWSSRTQHITTAPANLFRSTDNTHEPVWSYWRNFIFFNFTPSCTQTIPETIICRRSGTDRVERKQEKKTEVQGSPKNRVGFMSCTRLPATLTPPSDGWFLLPHKCVYYLFKWGKKI